MTEQILAVNINRRTESVIKLLGFSLPVLALILTCWIGYFSTSMIAIENPLILVFASISVLVPFKSENFKMLQKIVAFYLFAVLVNQTSGCYFSLSNLSVDASVSYSIVPLFLCTIGFLLDKLNSTNTQSAVRQSEIISAWLLAFVIIIVHMLFLGLIVHKFYGYGYGHDPNTIGNLVLYLLLFFVLWDKLANIRFRQCTGLILTFFYLITIFTNK